MLLMISDEPSFIWNTNGPVPQYTTFQSQVSGPALLFFSGSAFMNGGGRSARGRDRSRAGRDLADPSRIPEPHRVPAALQPVTLKYSKDPVQIGFSTNSGEVASDQNDVYQLALIY